jgi:mono/diheme cytochrome c family protein/DNA-binding beta-propeller fold protein YncE
VHLKMILPLALLVGCHEGKTPPPWGVPVSGGTMVVARSGSHAIIADPDRDRILAVDLATREVTFEMALNAGDQPGRVIEDGAGRFHSALRGGGALLTFNLAGEVLARRDVCGEPRGLAWDAATENVYVACATGELVTFQAAGGEYTRIVRLERDLRDVIVQADKLVITKFRSSEILTVDTAGAIVGRVVPPTVQRFGGFGGGFPESSDGGATSPSEPGGLVNAVPAVAWRMVSLPDGRIVVSHQRQVQDKLGAAQETGGYGTGCGSPVEAAITVIAPGQPPVAALPIAQGALPVDIAISKAGDKIAVLTAGNRNVRVQQTSFALSSRDMNDCRPPDFPDDPKDDDDMDDDTDEDTDEDVDEGGAPTALSFTPNGDLVVYFPEKPMLEIHRGGTQTLAPEVVVLPGAAGVDAGRSVFHRQTAIGLACASCHPEGREDGLVWDFVEFGKRRTQNLAGDILQRAPYHWSGDMNSLPTLMDDVFAVRMAGGALSERQKRSLGPWLNRIPAPAPAYTAPFEAIERGKAIFESAATGCVSCHGGALLTNNVLVDVGTGGKFKVPSLRGIGARAPFMHDGCAKTLTDRFTVCGNSTSHGLTQTLGPTEIADLVAYLETL